MDIFELVTSHPERVHPKLGRRIRSRKSTHIADTAVFSNGAIIGNVSKVGTRSKIEDRVIIEDHVTIKRFVNVGFGSVLLRGVNVGSFTDIGHLNLLCEGVKIPEQKKPDTDVQTNIRQSQTGCIIGPSVVLPSEFQLGQGAIVPIESTIRQVGRFGIHRRMVTIYGTDEGPRYSVGCQFGVTLETFKDRVKRSIETVRASSRDYLPYFGVFNEIGLEVQHAYDAEAKLIEELKSRHHTEVEGPFYYPVISS